MFPRFEGPMENNPLIIKFYSMEQEITHHSRGKLHVGQITVRESARNTK
jgi:hypothetical protein